jgi:hypothetical protein
MGGFGEWGRASVAKIIKNPTYMGVWQYGKRAKINGKWSQNPAETIMTLHVPSIVDEATWRRAEEIRKQNKFDDC